jgi:hypothetical protein
MKLSELKAGDVKVVQAAPQEPASAGTSGASESSSPLKLSSLHPEAITLVQKAPDPADLVYGPGFTPEVAKARALQSTKDRDQDSVYSILSGKPEALARRDQEEQAYAALTPDEQREVSRKVGPISGEVPMVIPAGAAPKLAQVATKLAEGEGLAYSLGRTALSAGQGAAMSAVNGKEGESLDDKLERMKSGAKLSGGIQLAAESIPVVGKVIGYGARKIGSTLTGETEGVIKTYAERTDHVNDMIKQGGGEVTEMADQARKEISDGIQAKKRELNGVVRKAISSAPEEKSIPINPVVEKLEAAKAKLNPNLKSDAVSEIDELIAKVKGEADEHGNVNLRSLHEVKEYLQEAGKSAYAKGGQIFSRAKDAAQAAKDAAAQARRIFNPLAPEAAEANNALSALHSIEDRLNPNLIKPGAPDSALMAAGSGANARNAKMLTRLEQASGVPALQKAKDLAAARAFASPSWLPKDATGKAAARMILGAGVGGAIDGKEGALVGGALTSPMALKVGINALNMGKGAVSSLPNVAQAIRQNPGIATALTQVTADQIRSANPPRRQEDLIETPVRQLGDAPKSSQDRKPSGGEARWIQSGAQKLGLGGSDVRDLQSTAQGRRLLIEASDLKPGSKAIQRVHEQIQKELRRSR